MIFNRLLIIISCLLMVNIIFYFLTSFNTYIDGGLMTSTSLLFTLTCLCLLIRNGDMIHSKQFIYIIINISIFILGATFKLMHWSGAMEMIIFSTYGIVLAYLFYFLMKKTRNWIAYLKLLYVASFFIPAQLVLSHQYNDILSREVVGYISIINPITLIFLTFHHIIFEKAWELYVREE